MTIHEWDGVQVMDLGEMDIWDGADLSLLRETLARLVEDERHPKVGVCMHCVKYIPSGFFGMLFDCHEKGTSVFLYSPQPNVGNMLWFRQFFGHQSDNRYRLQSEPITEYVSAGASGWQDDQDTWDHDEEERSIATAIGGE